MITAITAAILFACLVGVALLGRRVRRYLPADHLSAESKDAVKLAMGLVATMTALILGLLVSSAKGTYDTARSEVIEMAGQGCVPRPCPGRSTDPKRRTRAPNFATFSPTRFGACGRRREAVLPSWLPTSGWVTRFTWLCKVFPRTMTRNAPSRRKRQLSWSTLAELRSLLQAQSIPSISKPLLIALVCWLVVIFFGFSVIAPPNATTTLALVASAFLSCLRGFPNPGAGPPFCRADSNSQRAHDEVSRPAWKMTPSEPPLSRDLIISHLLRSDGTLLRT